MKTETPWSEDGTLSNQNECSFRSSLPPDAVMQTRLGSAPQKGQTNVRGLTGRRSGQIIGMSRETVTRTLADFRKQRIAELHGSTLRIF